MHFCRYLFIYLFFLLYAHFKFTYEGIFGNPDLEFNFLWLIHTIHNATRDDSDGITTGHRGVNVETVDVPVILSKNNKHIYTQKIKISLG